MLWRTSASGLFGLKYLALQKELSLASNPDSNVRLYNQSESRQATIKQFQKTFIHALFPTALTRDAGSAPDEKLLFCYWGCLAPASALQTPFKNL